MLASLKDMSGRLHISKLLKFKTFDRLAGTITINGKNSTAVVLGGFGFKNRHINKYSSLYNQFDFNVLPVLSSIKEMTHPSIMMRRGKNLTDQLQKIDQPLVIHVISGAFFTMIWTLEHMNKDWREKYIRAMVFDSCPPMSDVYAFGGTMAYMLKRHNLKPYISHLFHPYMYIAGLTDDWRTQTNLKMFGPSSVIPRNAKILFVYGKNDPVINYDYLGKFIFDRKLHHSSDTGVTEKVFEHSRHAMSLADYPEEYKQNVRALLNKIPEWNLCRNK